MNERSKNSSDSHTTAMHFSSDVIDKEKLINCSPNGQLYDISAPEFYKHGVWYPIVWRVLNILSKGTITYYIPKGEVWLVDIYLGLCWELELLGVILFFWFDQINHYCCIILLAVYFYRYFDILYAALSLLLRGFIRPPSYWVSPERILLLSLINVFELVVLFAFFYFTLSVFIQNAFSQPIKNIFDSIYFSVARPLHWVTVIYTPYIHLRNS